MANEYLQRTPTSTGNRRVWTFSYWIKRNKISADQNIFYTAQTSTPYLNVGSFASTDRILVTRSENGTATVQYTKNKFRDSGSWSHILVLWDTTHSISSSRVRLFVNGAEQKDFEDGAGGGSPTYPTINYEGGVNRTVAHLLGAVQTGATTFTEYLNGELTDVFFVDGQALTPDVFGFYKQGKGYISVGSTQATDFRPGQWVPKKPRVITTEINRRGGFGVNGFYLPMNDSNNFGADFHCTPNSIIKLQENLPQPRCRIDGVGDYSGSLRADPYAANLVLALPFVSGGLQSGFGDYSAAIKGSGSVKVGSALTMPSIGSTASHYGSAAFFNGSTQYLSIADSDDFNFGSGNFTIECWVNPSTTVNTTSYRRILSQQVSANWIFRLDNQGVFQTIINDGTNSYSITSGARIDTLGQWTHLAWVRNGTTLTNYINGVAVGIQTGVTTTIPDISNTVEVGRYVGGTEYYAGYLQDLRVYKGVAKYTSGFDVPRPYTPVGIATWRAVPDCTANNFATLNPLNTGASTITFTSGNLDYSTSSGTGRGLTTFSMRTGKWYCELRSISNNYNHPGIYADSISVTTDSNRIVYRSDGNVYRDGSLLATITSFTTGDIIGMSFDADTRQLSYYKNGTLVGGPYTATDPGTGNGFYFHILTGNAGLTSGSFNFGQNPTFSGNTSAGTFTDSNGKGLFKYQPPSGFLALCEDNLPTPAISDPGKYFKTVLYTGSGASRSVVGVGFTPDLVWIKARNLGGSTAYSHNLYDSVRPTGFLLASNETSAEVYYSGFGLSAMNSDGFSIVGGGSLTNDATGNYVAWCWRAGAGTTSTNTSGSVTSVVSVNQDAGFSIVSYTGNGVSNATVGHGLGKVPAFGVVKCRDTNSVSNEWRTQHKGLTSGNYIEGLANTSAQGSISATSFGSLGTFTSSSTVTLQAGSVNSTTTNESGKRYIMYLWAEIEGFSKFGSYVGNGNADGPFVYCGFKPAFVMIKRTDGGTENWNMFDNARKSVNDGDQRASFANLSDAEGTGWPIDFVSNGFKNRYTGSTNASGATYIFAAFAESPFQTANSK